jgi:hypothetical protein
MVMNDLWIQDKMEKASSTSIQSRRITRMRLNVSTLKSQPIQHLLSQLFSHTPAASIRIGWPIPAAATELPRC